MAKYLYLYSGSRRLKSNEAAEVQLATWVTYFDELGPALVDYGTPLIPTSQLLGRARASDATGFSVIQAKTFEEAVALTAGHPHLRNGGGIEVFEYMPTLLANGSRPTSVRRMVLASK